MKRRLLLPVAALLLLAFACVGCSDGDMAAPAGPAAPDKDLGSGTPTLTTITYHVEVRDINNVLAPDDTEVELFQWVNGATEWESYDTQTTVNGRFDRQRQLEPGEGTMFRAYNDKEYHIHQDGGPTEIFIYLRERRLPRDPDEMDDDPGEINP